MKKIIIALALISCSGIFFASCKSKQNCDAYKSSTPAHHKLNQANY
ncbi:MAG: hypothetical protein HY064_05720 [Bacteroidetes bacterium]|nr:hypothetical protein [Bacteroidota bacterium]